MRFNVSPSNLSDALSLAQIVRTHKNALPAMQHMRLVVSGDYVLITATDNDVTISVEVASCAIAEEGECLFDPAVLAAVLDQRAAKAASSVTLEQNSENAPMLIVGKQGTPLVKSYFDPLEYPALPKMIHEATLAATIYRFATCDLLYGLKIVSPFVSTDDGRPNLTGALLDVTRDPNTAMLVSTDGHSLGKAVLPCVVEGESRGVIIPLYYLAAVLPKVVHGPQTTLRFYKSEVSYFTPRVYVAGVCTRGAIFASVRHIDASFPDFTRVIPALNPKKTILVERKDLTTSAAEMTKISAAFDKSVKSMLRVQQIIDNGAAEVRLTGGPASLAASRDQSEITNGIAVSAIPVDPNAPNSMATIGINPQYLGRIAKSNAESLCELCCVDALSPMLWIPVVNTPKYEVLMITMPMRL